uniref:Uncharacterized protein n=1 Tax=Trichuris muris TaxID=70415 RepID=A0A5S6QC61_TRIMR
MTVNQRAKRRPAASAGQRRPVHRYAPPTMLPPPRCSSCNGTGSRPSAEGFNANGARFHERPMENDKQRREANGIRNDGDNKERVRSPNEPSYK